MTIVRRYQHSDAAAVIEMWERLHAADSAVARPSREDWEHYALDNDGERWFRVALVDGCIVGVMSALATVEESVGARSIQILVEPSQRRRGIGRLLLDAAFELDQGSLKLETLCPSSWSHADQFFRKNGFEVVEEELEMEAKELHLPTDLEAQEATFTIRQAMPSDAAVLAKIHEASFKHTLSYSPFSPEWFLRRIDTNKNESLRVAQTPINTDNSEQGVVGYCVSEIEEDERVVIEDIAVLPTHRRQGIARTLLVTALRDASSGSLRVDATNPGAITLYKSLGFKETGRSRRFHSLPHRRAA